MHPNCTIKPALLFSLAFGLGLGLQASEPPVRNAAELLELVRTLERRLDGKCLEAQYTFSSTPNKPGLRFIRQGYCLLSDPPSDPNSPDFHASFERRFSGDMNLPGKKATVAVICDMTQHRCSTDSYSEEFDGQYLWVTDPVGSKPKLRTHTRRSFPLPTKLLFASPQDVSEWGFPSGEQWDTRATPFTQWIELGIKANQPFIASPSKTKEGCWVIAWAPYQGFSLELEIDPQAGNAIRRCRTSRHREGVPADLGEIVETVYEQFEELAPGLFLPKRITAIGRVSLAYHFQSEVLKTMREKITGLPDVRTSFVTRTHVLAFDKLKLVNSPLILGDAGAFGSGRENSVNE